MENSRPPHCPGRATQPAALSELDEVIEKSFASTSSRTSELGGEKAAANITETGEAEVIDAIRKGRAEYYRRFDAFVSASGDRTVQYFQSLEPQFNAVRAECDRLLRLNQEASLSIPAAANLHHRMIPTG